MIFIDNKNVTDPRINLALDEYIVRTFSPEEDYVLFYINQPSIIIGKHQNTVEEINAKYVEEKEIIVVRRISGGGAVYHDFGNLNFSFSTKYDNKKVNNFIQFTKPILEALQQMGIPAEMTGRNDIVANGRKISGNAQFSTTKKMFSHGTLLFDSNIEDVVSALNVSGEKITSKGIKSVRSRVANITEFLPAPMSLEDFRTKILQSIFQQEDNFPTYTLSEEDWAAVRKLSEEKYSTWEWNYGRSPEFNVQQKQRFDFGQVDARIQVKDGLIAEIKFFGDFLGHGDLSEIEQVLLHQKYEASSLTEALKGQDLKHYFGSIGTDAFVDFLMQQ